MQFTSQLLPVGNSNIYGITYPYDEVEAVSTQITIDPQNPTFITMYNAPGTTVETVDMAKICAVLKGVNMESDGLYITAETLKTPNGTELEKMLAVPEFDGTLESVNLTASPHSKGRMAELTQDGFRTIRNITFYQIEVFVTPTKA